MRKISGVFALALLLLLTLFICGCPQSQKRTWWDDPLTAGEYSEGYQAGYDNGYLQGQTDSMEGQEMENTPPRPDPNRQDEYNDGYSSGYKIGYKEGWNAKPEEETAYKDGYRYGFNVGAEQGYKDYMSSKYEEGVQANINVSRGGRGKIWHLGCAAGVPDGYNYGVLLAKLKAEEPIDWYEDSLSSKVSREELLDRFTSLRLWCDADFDPHYRYELVIKDKFTNYKLRMMPIGGSIVSFEEVGTCKLSTSGEGFTLHPETFTVTDTQGRILKRPDEIKGVVDFEIEAMKVKGYIKLARVIDSRGKEWEEGL